MASNSSATSSRAFWVAILAAVCITACGLSAHADYSGLYGSSRFDFYFWRYSHRYQPDHDWKYLKAQCIQESALDPEAESHAGAVGLCQFMPDSWGEYSKAFQVLASRTSPHHSIRAAAWYMRRMERIWDRRGRTPAERLPLAWASYNCGAGCVIKAQERCNDGKLFPDIADCLPWETRNYPYLIRKHYRRL